jgi:hypothetical protein
LDGSVKKNDNDIVMMNTMTSFIVLVMVAVISSASAVSILGFPHYCAQQCTDFSRGRGTVAYSSIIGETGGVAWRYYFMYVPTPDAAMDAIFARDWTAGIDWRIIIIFFMLVFLGLAVPFSPCSLRVSDPFEIYINKTDTTPRRYGKSSPCVRPILYLLRHEGQLPPSAGSPTKRVPGTVE